MSKDVKMHASIMVGQEVRKLRKAANLSQWELAQILDVSLSSVQKYEQGIRLPRPRS